MTDADEWWDGMSREQRNEVWCSHHDDGADDWFGFALRVLNEAYKADHAAMLSLIENRVPCNAALADHRTIQVGGRDDGGTEVGMLGVINGICDAATGKRVAVCIDDQTGDIAGFIEYKPNVKDEPR